MCPNVSLELSAARTGTGRLSSGQRAAAHDRFADVLPVSFLAQAHPSVLQAIPGFAFCSATFQPFCRCELVSSIISKNARKCNAMLAGTAFDRSCSGLHCTTVCYGLEQWRRSAVWCWQEKSSFTAGHTLNESWVKRLLCWMDKIELKWIYFKDLFEGSCVFGAT